MLTPTSRTSLVVFCVASAVLAQYCPVSRTGGTCATEPAIVEVAVTSPIKFDFFSWQSGCVPSGYEDLTFLGYALGIVVGDSVGIAVKVANFQTGDKATAWLDLDSSGTFDPAEAFDLPDASGSGTVSLNGTIVIPQCSPVNGLVRLRVALNRGLPDPQPACGAHVHGDWEDYLLLVEAVPGDRYDCPIPATIGSTPGALHYAQWDTTPCGTAPSGVWFSLTPAVSGAYAMTLSSSDDEFWGVFVATAGAPAVHACGTVTDAMTVSLTAGQVYLIAVGNTWNPGPTVLTIAAPPAPPNDECSGAVPLALGVTTGLSNATASTSPAPAGPCGGQNDLWYSFTPVTSGFYSVSTCGLTSDTTLIAVYDGCGGTQLACGEAVCATQSAVSLPLAAGQTYRIRLAGTANQGASVPYMFSTGLQIAAATPPALSLTVAPGQLSLDVTGGLPWTPYFAPITLTHGNFPFGAFWGIDIAIPDLVLQWTAGAPFRANLDGLGAAHFGPFVGLPPGVALYGVAIVNLFSQNVLVTAPVGVVTL